MLKGQPVLVEAGIVTCVMPFCLSLFCTMPLCLMTFCLSTSDDVTSILLYASFN